MIIRQLRFPVNEILALVCFALLSSSGMSVEIPLVAKSFTPIEGGDNVESGAGVLLYLSSFDDVAYSASNGTDVVVLEDLSSLAIDENDESDENDDTYLFASSYYGYNRSSGEKFDSGVLVIEVPSDGRGINASGVKGFIRKTGPWVHRTTDQQFLLDGVTGTVSYQTLESTRDVTVRLNGSYNGSPFTVFGNTTASVNSSDFVTIVGWEADEGSDFNFSFASAATDREGNAYIGYLRRTDLEDPSDWESRFAVFQLTDTHDSDGDGIPDFSDLGATQILGVLSPNSLSLSHGQYWSNDLNTTVSVDAKQFWIYGENVGWFYMPDQDDPDSIRIYIADSRLGWLTTNKDMSPYYVRETDGVSVYFDRVDGNVSFYDTKLEAWFTVSY